MLVLVDTDALTKLGAGELLEEAVGFLGADLEECGRLPAVLSMLQRGRLHRSLGEARCATIRLLAERMPIAPPGDPVWLEQMVDVPAMDPGEAQLFAAAAADDALLLLTGDKRSLIATANVTGLREALMGRVVCLEAILMALCSKLGVTEVRKRMSKVSDLDTMLRVCVSAADCVAGFRSYRTHLVEEVGKKFLWGSDP